MSTLALKPARVAVRGAPGYASECVGTTFSGSGFRPQIGSCSLGWAEKKIKRFIYKLKRREQDILASFVA